MKLVNLTPHEITIHPTVGAPIVLPPPPKGEEVRLEGEPAPPSKIIVDGAAEVRVSYPIDHDRVVGLPTAPEQGVGYIVSAMVGDAKFLIPRQFQGCIFSPDTGKDAIRKDGQIVGVRGLILRY